MTGVRYNGSPGPEDTSTYVMGADPYVRCPVSAYTLERQILLLCEQPDSQHASSVSLDPQAGALTLSPAETTLLLPLRLGALKTCLDAIAQTDSWLLARSPVLYTDQGGEVHIDFPGLAGFTIAPTGQVMVRAVNPY